MSSESRHRLPARPVIGVFGHYGNRNLGDEAIVAATIQQLRQRVQDARIVCFSVRPGDTAKRHSVESFSVNRSKEFPGPVLPSDYVNAADLPWNRSEGQPSKSEQPGFRLGIKQRLKAVPVLGFFVKVCLRALSDAARAKDELVFIVRSAMYLRKIDLLVVAGSNQFLDNFGGAWGFPYALLKWSLLAKLTATKLAFVSVGAGPLQGRLSRLFVRCAGRLADYVSYRDSASKLLVETGWPGVDGRVFPDLAFGLDVAPRTGALRGDTAGLSVGINPMPLYDSRYWFEHDETRYRAYVDNLAKLAWQLSAEGHSVFFFSTMWRDESVIRDVRESLGAAHGPDTDGRYHVHLVDSVKGLIEVLQTADVVIATRFHSVVLPYCVGVPVLGIGYFRKTLDLMEQMGQQEYYEYVDAFSAETFWQKFQVLKGNWSEEQAKVEEKAKEYRARIAEQWDDVVGLLEQDRSS